MSCLPGDVNVCARVRMCGYVCVCRMCVSAVVRMRLCAYVVAMRLS